MLQDLLKTQVTVNTIKKTQLLKLKKNIKANDIKISYDQIFNMKTEDATVERKLDIPNPKLYAKALIHNQIQSQNNELPSQISEIYHTTIYSCENKASTRF